MRVLAAYGLDDVPKMSPEHTFVKSIFLLQILQYDDEDAPEDTVIYDLKISNVRLHHTILSASTFLHLPTHPKPFILHPIPAYSLD